MKKSITFLFIILLIPGIAHAADYYIAPDGNDAGAGNIGAPFKTFRPALIRAVPGDVIYVRGGTYGADNTMVYGASRDWNSSGATSCPAGFTLADGYCFYDARAFIGINDFSGWASSSPAYEVNDGTPDQPITVRNYPGETPILDVEGILWEASSEGDMGFCGGSLVTAGCLSLAVNVYFKSYWVIEGLEIKGGIVNISGGNETQQTHDITIRGCNIHDITLDGGDNPGIIRVNRGDIGGPYNIFIHNNKLHGIYDFEQPSQWDNVIDMQHFGAVTTLSVQGYANDASIGGTGYIEIFQNDIYNCPQAFFFKNPMEGPISIKENIIHHNGSLGDMQASNVTMSNNLVFDVPLGFWSDGSELDGDPPEVMDIKGQRATIANNTFIGMDLLLGIINDTGDHVIRNNVFFGMSGRVTGESYDTPAYIIKRGIEHVEPVDPQDSYLQTIESDNNCFISPYTDLLMVKRFVDTTRDLYGPSEAAETFGFDVNSMFIISDDVYEIFLNPDQRDYRFIDTDMCPLMGFDSEFIDDNAGNTSDGDDEPDTDSQLDDAPSVIKIGGGCGIMDSGSRELPFAGLIIIGMMILFYRESKRRILSYNANC